jgi:lipopolysaccharide transport system ATP-binding protein
MSDIAIRAEGLAKRYRIGAKQDWQTDTLRDTITHAATRSVQAAKRVLTGSPRATEERAAPHIWALKDVSFEIQRGEVVGVIGANGAGKSTLLRILSRITEPTEGQAEIRGRVGSLLDVGLGFHGELTGRENIYLSGALLGMKRTEIERNFDSIIEFSEVGKFIDTISKYYSTGMHMRLAFSVAAHLEPEILLVDEVLAVGDLAFQRKCLRKMESVAAHGRTVLFVSHNLAAMQELCQTAIVLVNGCVTYRGPMSDAVALYSRMMMAGDGDAASEREGVTRWRPISFNDYRPGVVPTLTSGAPFTAEAVLELVQSVENARFLCTLENGRREMVLDHAVAQDDLNVDRLAPGLHRLRIEFPRLWLAPGVYMLQLRVTGTDVGRVVWSEPAMVSVTGELGSAGSGILAAPLNWRLIDVPCMNEVVVS